MKLSSLLPVRSTTVSRVGLLVASIGLMSCNLDSLLTQSRRTPPTVTVVVDSAPVGGDTAHLTLITIFGPTAGAGWDAHIAGSASWLSLSDTTGVTPDSLYVQTDPTGLPVGVFRDTILLVVPRNSPPTVIPVEFRIRS